MAVYFCKKCGKCLDYGDVYGGMKNPHCQKCGNSAVKLEDFFEEIWMKIKDEDDGK